MRLFLVHGCSHGIFGDRRLAGECGLLLYQPGPAAYRHGDDIALCSGSAQHTSPGASQEVEKQTINRYFTLGLDYASSANWDFKVLVPYTDRSHTTYGAASNPLTPDLVSGATVSGLGDIKFITSFQGLLPTHNLGVQLGVKLPTGDYGGPSTVPVRQGVTHRLQYRSKLAIADSA